MRMVGVPDQIEKDPAQRRLHDRRHTFTDRAEQFLNDVKPPVLEKPFTASTLEGLLKRAQSR